MRSVYKGILGIRCEIYKCSEYVAHAVTGLGQDLLGSTRGQVRHIRTTSTPSVGVPDEASYAVVVGLELDLGVPVVFSGRSWEGGGGVARVPFLAREGARHQGGGGRGGLFLAFAVLAVVLTDCIFSMDLHVLPERMKLKRLI